MRIVAPDGRVWDIHRRLLGRRPEWRTRNQTLKPGTDVPEAAIMAIEDLPALAVAGIVVLLAIPLLLFIAELAVAALLVGVALVARVLLRRPWTVEARSTDPDEVMRWKVVGWRRSGEIVAEVARVLEAGGRDYQSPHARAI